MGKIKDFLKQNYLIILNILIPYLIFLIPTITCKNYIGETISYNYNFYECLHFEDIFYIICFSLSVLVTFCFLVIGIIQLVNSYKISKYQKILKSVVLALSITMAILSVAILSYMIYLTTIAMNEGIVQTNTLQAGSIVYLIFSIVSLVFAINKFKGTI